VCRAARTTEEEEAPAGTRFPIGVCFASLRAMLLCAESGPAKGQEGSQAE